MACCASDLAYSMIYEEEQGVRPCGCKGSELSYITRVQSIVGSLIPEGTVVNSGIGARAFFRLFNSANNCINSTVTLDGTEIYSHTGTQTIKAMGDDIIANLMGWTGSNVADAAGNYGLTLYTPAGDYNNREVIVAYFDDTAKVNVSLSSILQGGQYTREGGQNCLTTEQMMSLMEGANEICCGCGGEFVEDTTMDEACAPCIEDIERCEGWVDVYTQANIVNYFLPQLLGKSIRQVTLSGQFLEPQNLPLGLPGDYRYVNGSEAPTRLTLIVPSATPLAH